MGRDFNQNDYEMLLRLDDSLPSNKGANSTQISSLPTKTITAEDTKENCCICLNDFEEGDKVRSLPCLHKFHVQCIDEWLKLNKVCPIDKKAIDED